MDNKELLRINDILHSSQDKYVYYFLALAATALGFAVTQTNDMQEFTWFDSLLGLSVISWGASFWYGVRNREQNNLVLYQNTQLIIVQKGEHPTLGNNPEDIVGGIETVMGTINQNIEKLSKFGYRQRNWFFIGVIFFVVWRILVIALS